jgi:hypothetical protein
VRFRKGLSSRRRGLVTRYLVACLLASGVVLGAASQATAAQHAIEQPAASHTIASATSVSLGNVNSGGGGAVDFWTVQLLGGDQVQFSVQTPDVNCCTGYAFDLYPPGTTDANFATATPVMTAGTPEGSTQSVVELQAPYDGTFVLAVCEGFSGSCGNVDNGYGDNPMDAYTFTPTLVGGGIAAGVGAKETQASPTIAGAAVTPVGNFESGGGNAIDFWKVQLLGGDKVQFSVQSPYVNCCTGYAFDLYPPGTTDTSFPAATPVMTTGTAEGNNQSIVVLQAPYTGTFVLAVCEGTLTNCGAVDSGYADNPMNAYTFTPTLIGGGVATGVGAKETQASDTIAGGSLMPVGNFESGGGNAIDFWKVHLLAGDKVQFSVQTPYVNCCQGYAFDLYPPGTTDTNFRQKAPSASTGTPEGNVTSVVELTAPHTGTFILAVCEGVSDCRSVDNGDGDNPMGPYTFKPTLVGGHETKTSLRLSATTITLGHEKKLKLTATVTPLFSGHPGGTVTILAGKKLVCRVTLADGKGTCRPRSNTLLASGTYSLTASYAGSKNFASSTSASHTLMVQR